MKNIFITGASGCVGHYILELLAGHPEYHLHCLVRKPERIKFPVYDYTNISLHRGDLKHIEDLKAVLGTMHAVLHVATDWSNSDYATFLNVEKTKEMLSYTDPDKLEKVIYFSTASILGPNNQPVPEAGKFGSGYVKSKYYGHEMIQESIWKDKTVTLFPTLVFGGNATYPQSHIHQGIIPNLKYLKFLRFLSVDGAFHFVHAKDIALVTKYVLEHDLSELPSKDLVLGFESLTVRDAIDALCKAFHVPVFGHVRIPKGMIFGLAKWVGAKIGPWERYCIENSHMVYDVVNPKTFGVTPAFPTLEALLEDIKSYALNAKA